MGSCIGHSPGHHSACKHTRTHKYIHTRTRTHTHRQLHTHTRTITHSRTNALTQTSTNERRQTHAPTRTHTLTHKHTHPIKNTQTHTKTHAQTHVVTNSGKSLMYTNTNAHTHTRIEIEHPSFSLFVFSTSGVMGTTAMVVYKRLASMLSDKHNKRYSKMVHWLHCRLSFFLHLSSIRCLRGSLFSIQVPEGPLTEHRPSLW